MSEEIKDESIDDPTEADDGYGIPPSGWEICNNGRRRRIKPAEMIGAKNA